MSNLVKALNDYGFQIKDGVLDLPKWVRRVKFDVGLAFNAPNSEIWLRESDDLLVFGFEPILENFKALSQVTQDDYLRINPERIGKNFFPLRFAIGETPRFTEMFVTERDAGCSSLLQPLNHEVARKETVEVIRLDSLLELLPWHQIEIVDHIKIDCQGTDIEVLRSAGQYLSQVLAVTIEPDDYSYQSSQNSYINIAKYLRNFAFINQHSPNVTLSVLSNATSRLTFLRPIKTFMRKMFYEQKRVIGSEIDVHDPTFINSKLKNNHLEALSKIKQQG